MSKKKKGDTITRKQAMELALNELVNVAGRDFLMAHKEDSWASETGDGPYEIMISFDKTLPSEPNADGSVTLCDLDNIYEPENYVIFSVDLIPKEVCVKENSLKYEKIAARIKILQGVNKGLKQ